VSPSEGNAGGDCCGGGNKGVKGDGERSSSPLLDALLGGGDDEEAQPQRWAWKKTAAALSIDSMDVSTPDWSPGQGRMLLHRVCLEVPVGARVLVTGPSGCGKTSFLRAIAAGLESSHACECGNDGDRNGGRERGVVQSCFDWEAVACVPQSPHLFDGSLRANLCFPSGRVLGRGGDEAEEDSILEAALTAVRLQHLVQGQVQGQGQGQGLEKEAEWHRILTPGEKQRLEFARLLVQRGPGLKLVLLDEPTASLGKEDEENCFRALLGVAPGLTVVTATHKVASLTPLHTHSLSLDPSSSTVSLSLVLL
jgi:putative ATP-binding cassette transporter